VLHSILSRPVVFVWAAITAPLTVFVLHAGALWIWHLPALYDRALAHDGVHLAQHACFFGTAALFWWGIAHGRYGQIPYSAAAVYLVATAVHGGVLGALMVLSPHVWYASYLARYSQLLTPLEDQQLAGMLMWVPAALILAAAGMTFFAAALRESERRTRFKASTGVQRP
jgi:cytochrome c oxidase assembly factor CtaG